MHLFSSQACCNITAGAAFCIGLRYAGTEDPTAFKTLNKILKLFLGMESQFMGEFAGKATVESCLMLIVLSMSLVRQFCSFCCFCWLTEFLLLIFSRRSLLALATLSYYECVACFGHAWDHPIHTSHTVLKWPSIWPLVSCFWVLVVLRCHVHRKPLPLWCAHCFPNFPPTATTTVIICKRFDTCTHWLWNREFCCPETSIRESCA